jgi:hypothetical protein
MRSLASGKNVTTFTVASNEFIGGGREKAEYHPVVTWDRLAEIAGLLPFTGFSNSASTQKTVVPCSEGSLTTLLARG